MRNASRPRALAALLVSLVTVCAALAPKPVLAQSADVPAWVPAPLAPWVPWARFDADPRQCAFLDGDAALRRCAWPGQLALTLDARGGRFAQTVRVDTPVLFALPGEASQWPVELRVDGKPAPVLAEADRPVVALAAGDHALEGRFVWDRAPQVLRVPTSTALLSLTLGGARIDFPNRDTDGRLWLDAHRDDAAGAEGADARDALEVSVHRRMVDDVPFLLETQLTLQVAGRAREIVLGPVTPAGFAPMRLESALPARIEPDGRLRVQIRPGTFEVELLARHEGPVEAVVAPGPILSPAGQMPWTEEVWTFAAETALRQVEVSGVASVDPTQTRLPDAWRSLPAWQVKPGDTVTLRTLRRGDPAPPPDRLSLTRDLWLDVDGGGFTVRDRITGAIADAWRLDARAPLMLGRVSVGGRDQLVTRGEEGTSGGVELREGALDLVADSRIEGAVRTLPAIGWAHDFERVSATLHLAPGWKLFDASGADSVPGTWLRTWSLFDLFLLLVTALAVAKLHGRAWGAVALATLVLTMPEDDAPYAAWICLVALHALILALPVGRARQLVRYGWWAAAAALVVIALPFMVEQVRVANYPVLEHPWSRLKPADGVPNRAWTHEEEAGNSYKLEAPGAARAPAAAMKAMEDVSESYVQRAAQSAPLRKKLQVDVDPQAAVQTGPGLPSWTWNRAEVSWSGPVQRAQALELTLIPPSLSRVLGWARAALVAALGLCVLGLVCRRGRPWPGTLDPPDPETKPDLAQPAPTPEADAPAAGGAAAVVALLLALLLTTPGPAAATSPNEAGPPSAEVLATLRERLFAEPLCTPRCADVSALRIDARRGRLSLELDVSAGTATAVRLPSGDFRAERVSLGNSPALVLREKDADWVRLPAGVHTVRLEGPLPTDDAIDLTLPSRPRRVQATLDGFTLMGVDASGVPQETLQLVREARAPAQGEPADVGPGEGAETAALPAFGRIERTLTLGLQWTVETRVERTSPTGSPLVLQVPLLAGESVTTAGVEVTGGRALVSLGPNATEFAWTSVLAPAETLSLKALEGQPATEVWRMDVSPIWHVETSGIPVVRRADASGERRPEWRPWPGEGVDFTIRRPPALDGATLTIDSAHLEVRPGVRATDYTLELSPRTSRGGPWGFALPEGARIQSVQVSGTEQPVSADSARVDLALAPGANTVSVRWQSDDALSPRFETPALRVGDRLVNIEVTVHVPDDRWVLFVGGGQYGPAVLFWSVFVVLVLVAFGLGYTRRTPLGFGAWLALGLGISQTDLPAALIVVVWLFALAQRGRMSPEGTRRFNAIQVGLVMLTTAALVVLVVSIQDGLLGRPDMQVTGNASHDGLLNFFADRTAGDVPPVWFVSLPLTAYRVVMLVWALWLARALIGWARWGWGCFGTGGLWRGRTPAPAPQGSEAP